jgi:hypothetical protein
MMGILFSALSARGLIANTEAARRERSKVEGLSDRFLDSSPSNMYLVSSRLQGDSQ